MPNLTSLVGVITAPAATGNQTYNLPAGAGNAKAVLLWMTEQAADGSATHAQFSIGFGTDRGGTKQERVLMLRSVDGGATTSGGHQLRSDMIVMGNATDGAQVSLVEFGTGTMVLNWLRLGPVASNLVNYAILTDGVIADALAIDFGLTSTGATQAVTVASGFGQPDAILFLAPAYDGYGSSLNGGGTSSACGLSLGVALKATTANCQAATWAEDMGVAPDVGFWQQAGAILQLDQSNLSTEDTEITMSGSAAWPTDGFELTKTNNPAANVVVCALPLKLQAGISATLLSSLANPITGTTPVVADSAVGFQPGFAFLFGGTVPDTGTAPNTTHANLGGFWVGATDSSSEVVAGFSQEDGAAAADTYQFRDSDKAVQIRNPDDGTVLAEADVSFSGSNVRFSWPDIDPTLRAFRGFVIQAAPTAALSGYTITNELVDRSFNANLFTLEELADVLGTLINDLSAGNTITGYAPTNFTTDRAFDANNCTEDELADVLGTLINDYQTNGTISGFVVSNAASDRTYDANLFTIGELADVLATVIADLQSVAEDAGTGISARAASGADVFTAAETGTGISTRSASGAKEVIGGGGLVYTKTGSGVSALVASGASASVFVEAGLGASARVGSGARSSSVNPKAHTLTDSFDDNSRDESKWHLLTDPGTSIVSETGGRVEVALSTTGPSSNGYESDINYDLTDSYISVQVVDAGNYDTSDTAAQLYWINRTTNDLLFIRIEDPGVVTFGKRIGNGALETIGTLTYVPDEHHFLRLFHDGTNVLGQVSANGSSWTNVGGGGWGGPWGSTPWGGGPPSALGFTPISGFVGFVGSVITVQANPGTVIFDQFNLFTVVPGGETGAGISERKGSGADATTYVESGMGVSERVASGVKLHIPSIFGKTGAGISTRVASGASASVFAETGSGIAPRVGSGSRAITQPAFPGVASLQAITGLGTTPGAPLSVDVATIRLQALDGTWETLGVGRLRGLVAEGIQASSNEWGPDTLSFQVKALSVSVERPDLLPFTPVELEVGGIVVWSGRTMRKPNSDFEHQVSCMGWQYHLDDDSYRRIYVHTRQADWSDWRGFLESNIVIFNGKIQVSTGSVVKFFKPLGVTYAQNDAAGVLLDTWNLGGAKRVVLKVSNGNWESADLFLNASNSRSGLGTSAIPVTNWGLATVRASTGLEVTLPEAKRYLLLFVKVNLTHTQTTGDTTLTLEEINIFADTAYETANASILKADTVVKDARNRRAPLLSSSDDEITAGTFTIPEYVTSGYQSPRQTFEQVNAYENYLTKIGGADLKSIVFKPKPATPIIEVGNWSGSEFADASVAGDELYSKVIIEASDAGNLPLTVSRHVGHQTDARFDFLTDLQPANPGFEVDTADWTVAAGSLARDTSIFHEGAASGRLTTTSLGDATVRPEIGGLVGATFTPGTLYQFVVYLRKTASLTGSVSVNVLADLSYDPNATLGQTVVQASSLSSTAFTAVTVLAEAYGTSLFLEISASGQPASTSILYIDTASIRFGKNSIPERRGFPRSRVLPIRSAITQVVAERFGDLWIAEHRTAPFSGTLSVKGPGAVRRVLGGASVPPHVLLRYTGEKIRLSHRIDPDTGAVGRDGRIASVSYSHDDRSAEITVDDRRQSFEKVLERYGVLADRVR